MRARPSYSFTNSPSAYTNLCSCLYSNTPVTGGLYINILLRFQRPHQTKQNQTKTHLTPLHQTHLSRRDVLLLSGKNIQTVPGYVVYALISSKGGRADHRKLMLYSISLESGEITVYPPSRAIQSISLRVMRGQTIIDRDRNRTACSPLNESGRSL